MKYTILINQAGIVDAGLNKSTDLIDWALLGYIADWQLYPKSQRLEGHVWLDYKNLMTEMPMLGLNSKSAVSNRITKLAELNLISIKRDLFSRVYVQLNEIFWTANVFRPGVEQVVHESEHVVHGSKPGVHVGEPGVHVGEPGVHESAHIIDYKLIDHKLIDHKLIKPKNQNGTELLAHYGIVDQLALDFIEHRKSCGKSGKGAPITKTAMDGFEREAALAGITAAEAVRISIERNWQGFNAGWDWRPKQSEHKLGLNQRGPAPQYIPKDQRNSTGVILDLTAERL